MSNGTVTYSGLLIAKGVKYTQTRGVTPDKISVRMIPQTSAIAATGNLTLGYGIEFTTIENCLADKSGIWLSSSGFTGTVVFQDKRWRWSRQPAVNRHWNERGVDGEIIGTPTSLRKIIEFALLSVGEVHFAAGMVADDFYPEIDVEHMRPDVLLEQVTSDYGYSVCIGYSGDPVRVFPNGIGFALPGTNLMAYSQSLDPPTPPAIVRVAFGPSEAQAIFKLTAAGLDTDGSLKEFDDLSYTPSAGWEKEPLGFPNVKAQHGDFAHELAMRSVYRFYAITSFADSTLKPPGSAVPLTSISQVLPLLQGLLETEVRNGQLSRAEPRVYGKHFVVTGTPLIHTPIEHHVQVPFDFNANQGLLKFSSPMFISDFATGKTKPADLRLEAGFRIRNATTRQFLSYTKDIVVNGAGYGYHTIHDPAANARSIVQYNRVHVAQGIDTNQGSLDSLATLHAAAAIGQYNFEAGEMRWYNRPMWGIRCDGQVTQVMHVISDGTDGEPGHYTVAAKAMEFDQFIRTESERRRDIHESYRRQNLLSALTRSNKERKGNA